MQKTGVLEAGLKCFGHPSTWVAILLLLVNDFFFKQTFPSWWTGKLSDFAGLFFFPFIVVIVFGLLFRRTQVDKRKIGIASFVFTALWFSLMKTNPVFNILTTIIWSWLAGSPTNIVLDPSDILAIIVLVPAWRLWNSQLTAVNSRSISIKKDWKTWLALGVGTIASIASSCEGVENITRVVYVDNVFYVGSWRFARFNMDSGDWEDVTQVPEQVEALLNEPAALPVTSCLEESPTICYQVNGEEQVLISRDGGGSWEAAWKIPPGRRQFIVRLRRGCDGVVDMGPYDLIATGSEDAHYVVVAMGNEGTLIRHPDGSWIRQGVWNAEPTPFSVSSFFEIYSLLLTELYGSLHLASLFTIWLFLSSWKQFRMLLDIIIYALLLTVLLGLFLLGELDILGFLVSGMFGFLVLLAGGFLVWRTNSIGSFNPSQTRNAAYYWAAAGIGSWLFSSIPIILWAVGIIPYYNLSLAIAGILTIAVVSWGTLRVREMMRGAES